MTIDPSTLRILNLGALDPDELSPLGCSQSVLRAGSRMLTCNAVG